MFFICLYWALIYGYCNDLRVGNFMASRHEDRQGHLIFLLMSRDGDDRPCRAYGCVNLLHTEHTWECHVISCHQWGTTPSVHYPDRIVHFVRVYKGKITDVWCLKTGKVPKGLREEHLKTYRLSVNEMPHKSDLNYFIRMQIFLDQILHHSSSTLHLHHSLFHSSPASLLFLKDRLVSSLHLNEQQMYQFVNWINASEYWFHPSSEFGNQAEIYVFFQVVCQWHSAFI